MVKKFLIHCINVEGVTTFKAQVLPTSVPESIVACTGICTLPATVVDAFGCVEPAAIALHVPPIN